MKEVLGKIMQPQTAPAITATIVGRTSIGKWALVDALGRESLATGSIHYRPGALVLVRDGVIIGAAASETIKRYEV